MSSVEKVKEYLKISGGVEQSRQLIDLIMSETVGAEIEKDDGVPEKIKDKFRELIKTCRNRLLEELEEFAIEIYTQNFSDSEMDELIRFSQSSVSQKLKQMLPKVQRDSLVLGQLIATEECRKFAVELELLEKELDEEGMGT